MNTNNLKRFAQEARKKLIEQVTSRLSFVLQTDTTSLREQSDQLLELRNELNHTTQNQLIEKVAYTWFNRLMALRFMDANDYQPLSLRVITPREGYITPEILDEAKRGNIPAELKLDRQRVLDLLDGKVESTNPQNEAYKMLLIAVCNHLSTVFPFLFEKINDYTELLMPDDVISEFCILKLFREGIPIEDCKNVEIIGWLYQFYISERKDEVFASKEKVSKTDIPAATQLFTPRWIVEYMVQNTLGKLWLQNRPQSRLREMMPYFIESESLNAGDSLKISSPEEIRFLDSASGSGHILVYAFELFTRIYEEEGYNTGDIPKLIIEKNLYGFEIDERAAQLSGLALMMKAREYQRRVFRKEITPNVMCFKDLPLTTHEIRNGLADLQIPVPENLIQDLMLMQQATNYGSLIIPKAKPAEIRQLLNSLESVANEGNLFQAGTTFTLQTALQQLENLAAKFHCVVTNPPYMGGGKMNTELSNWVKVNYPDAKSDLNTCFVERGLKTTVDMGFNGYVIMESWMFLSSFEDFRKKLLKNSTILSLSHFGWHIMRIAFGTVAFILENSKPKEEFRGTYSFMEYDNINKDTDRPIEFPVQNNGRFKLANQKDFEKIPGWPIGYWLSKKMIDAFQLPKIGSLLSPKSGMSSTNNDRFLRFWYEAVFRNISFDTTSIEESLVNKEKWYPYGKGGNFRKWIGNNEYVINYGQNGKEIKFAVENNPNDPNTKHWSRRIFGTNYFFRKGITWSRISSSNISFRVLEQGVIFSDAGPAIFPDESFQFKYFFGSLNSNFTYYILQALNPTLTFQVGDIASIPYKIEDNRFYEFEKIIDLNCEISKSDWTSTETSWDFKCNELIRLKSNDSIFLDEAYDLYQYFWTKRFFKLHQSEETLNRQFIEIYGLQDELTPDVPLEDITILQDELDRKALAQLNQKLERNPATRAVMNYESVAPPFMAGSIISQFVSYAVGCMFGRFSLDKEGLILANQGETVKDYLEKIGKTAAECAFLPDADNIIPILDDEWFEDDITGRFHQFLKVTFGAEHFQENLRFIEKTLGKDIRKYFMKDFYTDHVQRYKKRPIYWMFSSPKGSFNVLIYMHRYIHDTPSLILNKYLREFIGKLRTRKDHLRHLEVTGLPQEKAAALREMDKIDRMLTELIEYERDVLFPLAVDRVSIDLDDGVLVNYNKMGKAIREISGLNDAVTKKKVSQFDWTEKKGMMNDE